MENDDDDIFGEGEFAKANPELADSLADRMLAKPEEYTAEAVEAAKAHKGRKKLPKESSKEIAAVDRMAEDIKAAEELYADGMPYELERIENELRFFKEQAGIAFLEMGKRLIRIKAHEGHGGFLKTLDNLDMVPSTAQKMMAAARRFSNAPTWAHLGPSKLKALSVLDDDEIEKLELGEPVRGVAVDRLHQMTVRELRETLKKAEDALKQEKAGREKDREVQEKAIAQKEQKINELDQQLRYQQPPTKQQLALAELQKLNESYTFVLARINAGIREALGIVKQAEKTPGTDALQLSEWLNQFDIEMQAFNDISGNWLNEVDNVCPVNVGTIRALDDVPELG